ncbi:MAG: LPS-assembly protein LptD, partial [Nitrosomonas sp.]|nr:LPS-assembly protein LptD [Nitrosomonas sp.]
MNIPFIRIISILFLSLVFPLIGLCGEPSTQSESEQKSVVKPKRKPVVIEADHITGYYKQEIEATGNAELHYEDNILTADRMKYFQATDDTEVEGNVRLERPKDILKGNDLQFNLKTEEGRMSEPRYYIKDGKGRGAGSLLLFEGKDNYRLKETNYTTCPEGNNDWYIRAKELEIDNKKEVGTARGVSVMFKDTPILYS